MLRRFAILLAMTLLATACAGGEAEPPASPTPTEDETDDGSAPSAPDTSTTQPAGGEEPVSSGDEGTGTAMVGDMNWEFALDGGQGGICDVDVGDSGLLFIVLMFGTDEDGREITLNISGPASGGEAVVQAGSAILAFERWTADRAVYERLASIEGMPEGIQATAQVDGNTVSGSGVFYDDTTLTRIRPSGDPYDAGVLEGTFSATCPAK